MQAPMLGRSLKHVHCSQGSVGITLACSSNSSSSWNRGLHFLNHNVSQSAEAHSNRHRQRHWIQFAIPYNQQPDRADVRVASSVSDSSLSSSQRPTAFKKHSITGDGSCMFRAVAQGHNLAFKGSVLPSSEEYQQALQLRKAVVGELNKRRQEIEPFLPGIADDFDEYLKVMSQPGVWGGEPELLMASHVLQQPIAVYQSDWGGPQYILTYGEEYCKASDPMHLLWSGAHYDLLLPVPTSRL